MQFTRSLAIVYLLPFGILTAAGWSNCLNGSEAQNLAHDYGYLISSWVLNTTYSEALGNTTIAENYFDYSDSVVALESEGCAFGPQPLDNNSAQFAADQLNVPPFKLEVLQVWHNCETITFRWISPQTPDRAVGIVVLETVVAPRSSRRHRLISGSYSEFNSAAWLVNIGAFKPSCNGSEAKR